MWIERLVCLFKGHQAESVWTVHPNPKFFTGRRCVYCHKIQMFKPGDIIIAWDRDY